MAAINYNITNDGTSTITSLTFVFVTPSETQLVADFSNIKSGEPTDFSGSSYTVSGLNFLPLQVLSFSVNYTSGETGIYNGSVSVTGTSASGEDTQLIPTEITVTGSECLATDVCVVESTQTRIYYNVAWYPIVITQPNQNYYIDLTKSNPDLDTWIFLYDSNGDYVDDRDSDQLDKLFVSNLDPGTYYVGVAVWDAPDYYGQIDYYDDQFRVYSSVPLPTGCSIILDVCPPEPIPFEALTLCNETCIPGTSNVQNNVAWYTFTLTETKIIEISTTEFVSDQYFTIILFDSNGNNIDYNYNGGFIEELQSGTYYIGIARGFNYASNIYSMSGDEPFTTCFLKLNVCEFYAAPGLYWRSPVGSESRYLSTTVWDTTIASSLIRWGDRGHWINGDVRISWDQYSVYRDGIPVDNGLYSNGDVMAVCFVNNEYKMLTVQSTSTNRNVPNTKFWIQRFSQDASGYWNVVASSSTPTVQYYWGDWPLPPRTRAGIRYPGIAKFDSDGNLYWRDMSFNLTVVGDTITYADNYEWQPPYEVVSSIGYNAYYYLKQYDVFDEWTYCTTDGYVYGGMFYIPIYRGRSTTTGLNTINATDGFTFDIGRLSNGQSILCSMTFNRNYNQNFNAVHHDPDPPSAQPLDHSNTAGWKNAIWNKTDLEERTTQFSHLTYNGDQLSIKEIYRHKYGTKNYSSVYNPVGISPETSEFTTTMIQKSMYAMYYKDPTHEKFSFLYVSTTVYNFNSTAPDKDALEVSIEDSTTTVTVTSSDLVDEVPAYSHTISSWYLVENNVVLSDPISSTATSMYTPASKFYTYNIYGGMYEARIDADDEEIRAPYCGETFDGGYCAPTRNMPGNTCETTSYTRKRSPFGTPLEAPFILYINIPMTLDMNGAVSIINNIRLWAPNPSPGFGDTDPNGPIFSSGIV